MRAIYWIGLFLMSALTANAQTVPYSFNYQGVLRDGSDKRLGAVQKTAEFRLYDSATGGAPLWGRTYTVQLDTNGLFNVVLSDRGAPLSTIPLVPTPKDLNEVIASTSDLYLGLTVSGAAEIAPRQKLLSVPFAMIAGDVQSASGEFKVMGALTAESGLTVKGVISATTSLQVGNTTLTSTGTGTLSVPSLDVTGNANVTQNLSVAGNAAVTKNLSVAGITTVSDLTVSGKTTLGSTTINGPVSLFSHDIPFTTNDVVWVDVKESTADHQLLSGSATSDGFIIINFWYDLETKDKDDKNQILYDINFSKNKTITRTIQHGIYYNDVDAHRITKHDAVTLPILKGEIATLHRTITFAANHGTRIQVRAVFVPFGTSL